MKRPRSHVIEDRSSQVLRSLLPSEWIVRPIAKDYGIDFEVEILDQGSVTANRIWFQLRGTEHLRRAGAKASLPDGLREAGGPKYVAYTYGAFAVKTKLLEYALRCDFPLLLAVCDLSVEDVYWLPLRNELEVNVEPRNTSWMKQGSVTLRLPLHNSLKHERGRNFYGLRWFALETARMRAFGLLHYYYHELQYEARLSGYVIGEGFIDHGEEEELVRSLHNAIFYLRKAIRLDVLFGPSGLDLYVQVIRPQIEEGIDAAAKVLHDIERQRVSFMDTSLLIAETSHAVNLLSTCIAQYQDFKAKFLLTHESVIANWLVKRSDA